MKALRSFFEGAFVIVPLTAILAAYICLVSYTIYQAFGA